RRGTRDDPSSRSRSVLKKNCPRSASHKPETDALPCPCGNWPRAGYGLGPGSRPAGVRLLDLVRVARDGAPLGACLFHLTPRDGAAVARLGAERALAAGGIHIWDPVAGARLDQQDRVQL